MYSSTLSLTLALEDGVAGQRHAPGHLTPGTHCTGGCMGPRPVWKGAENLAPPLGFDPRIVQSVANRYTN